MARRVNTKFLIILTVAVIGVGLAGLIIHKLRRGDPAKYVKAANELVAQRNYEEAVKNFQQAVSIEAKQPDVWVAYGDALTQLVDKDPDNAGRALKAWHQAMELDPNHKGALSRMLTLYLADSEARSPNAATVIEKGRDVAARLAKVDPGNLTAVSAAPLFTLRGMAHSGQNDPERMAAAVKELAELSAKHPENHELTAYATGAKLTQAQQVARSQPAEARKLVDEAAAIMTASLKAAPDSAAMQFQGFQIFSVLAPVAATPEARQQHADAAKAALAEAIKLAKPQDELYGSIQMISAAQAVREKDRPRGEKIARDLLAARPDDLAVRLQVAVLLAEDPAKRREAIEILQRPSAPQPVSPRRFHLIGRMEVQTLITLTNLRLEEYAATNDEAQRKALHPKIEDGLSKLIVRVGGGADNPLALKLRGKYQRLRGEHVAAIQTLSKAVTLMDQQEAQRGDVNYLETIDLLARSYIDTQQTGPAKELLSQIVAQREAHAPSRLMLARLLVQERDFDAARPHIDYLEKQLPDLPDVIKLRLATLDREKGKDKIKAAYARLPEKTRGEILDKANTANAIGEHAEVERLLTAQLAAAPGDPQVSVPLARWYASREQRDKANAIVADALAAHPDNKVLQLLQKQLANASPEELRQFRLESIEELSDPTQKAIQLAELAAAEGKPEEALRQLQEAEKASPDNMRIKQVLFTQHLARKQWDEASRYLEILAKANHDQAGGLRFRAQLALAKGDAQAALKHGLELTQRLPEFGQSWLAYGQALQASQKFEEATQRYATALEKQPDNLEAMRGMVECYAALNRPADVKRYIDAALRLNPNHPYFLEQQTNYELSFGDPTRALPQREAMLQRNPENPQAWGAAAQAYLAASRFKAGKQDEAGAKEMLAKAADTLKQAIAKFPDDRRFYAGYADAAWAMKDVAGAEAVLKQLAARDAWKDKPEPQLMMAEFLARTGKLDESEALLRSLVAKHPADVGIQLSLVSLLSQRGKAEEALAALQANPNDPRVRGQLVQLQIGTNKLEEADKTIQAALAADPKSVRYQALAGFVSMGRGRWDEADARLQAALKLDARDPVALYYHGLLRMQQPGPNIDEAVQRLTAAREAQPDAALLVDVRFALAQALARRNDVDGASRELEAALQAQPNNKRLRLTLIDLYMSGASPRLVDAERTIREGRELASNDPDLLRAEAMMWLRRKDSAKAIAAARQAVAAAPKDENTLSKFLEILLDAREYATAVKEADQMVAADKNRWWAYMLRGVARRYSADKDGAIQDFEAALAVAAAQRNDGAAQRVIDTLAREIGVDEALARILPRAETEYRWRLVAAQLYQRKGNYERAAEMVEAVLAEGEKLSPLERAQALRFAGGLYLMYQPQPQAGKAYDAYLKLLDLQPNDLGSLNNMACLVAETISPPRPAEAMKYSRRAYDLMISAGVREPLIMDTHGWVLTLNDRPQEGIDVLRQAIALRSFPEAHYHLGEAYLKTAAAEDAQKQLELAAEQLRQAEEKKQDVDPVLRSKVDAALARAKELARTKSAAANP